MDHMMMPPIFILWNSPTEEVMARSASYLERSFKPLDCKKRDIKILSIGSCMVDSIDDERRAAFFGPILLIGGKAK